MYFAFIINIKRILAEDLKIAMPGSAKTKQLRNISLHTTSSQVIAQVISTCYYVKCMNQDKQTSKILE